jgi:hypothetical protein
MIYLGHEADCAEEARPRAEPVPQLKARIRDAIASHLNEVRFCHEKLLIHQTDCAGRVMVEFRIEKEAVVAATPRSK